MIKEIYLKQINDAHDGTLSIAEAEGQIPFKIKRVFYIYDFKTSKSKRGFHAHKKLKQVIFALSGYFTLTLDNGFNKETMILNDPNKGILIDRCVWHTMREFSEDCIILVFASELYREDDYIREYKSFIKYLNKND